MASFDINNIIKTQNNGVQAISSEDLIKNFKSLGLVNEYGDSGLDKRQFQRQVQEFSYFNRNNDVRLQDFFKEYKISPNHQSPLDVDINKDLNVNEDGVADIRILPLKAHKKEKIAIKDLPLKDGFVGLNRSYVGQIIEHGPAQYQNDKTSDGLGSDSYRVLLSVPGQDKNAKPREYEIWGKELETVLKTGGKNLDGYHPGDFIAISNSGKDEVVLQDGRTKLQNTFNIEAVDKDKVHEAVKHYQQTDLNYNRIARHGLGKSGLDNFVKQDESKNPYVDFQSLTLEDFNAARGADSRPITMQEKREFEENKKEFLDKTEKEPTIEQFALDYGYEIKQNSSLDNDKAKSLQIIPQGQMSKTRGEELQKANNNELNHADAPTSTNTNQNTDKKAVADYSKSQFAPTQLPHNTAMPAQQTNLVQLNGAAAIGYLLRKNTPIFLNKTSNALKQIASDFVNGVKSGWGRYNDEKAKTQVFSPTVNNHSLSDEIDRNITSDKFLDNKNHETQKLKESKELVDDRLDDNEDTAIHSAKKNLKKDVETPNPYEGLEKMRADKKNLENFDEKKNKSLLSEIGDKIGYASAFIKNLLTKLFSKDSTKDSDLNLD